MSRNKNGYGTTSDSVSRIDEIPVSTMNINYGTISAKMVGTMVIVQLYAIGISSSLGPWGQRQVGSLDKRFAPKSLAAAALATDDGVAMVRVESSGGIYVSPKASTIAPGHNFEGQVTYFIG